MIFGFAFYLFSPSEEPTNIMFLRSCNIIVHLMLSSTRFPANVNSFIKSMMSIIMFDLLDFFEDFNLYEKTNLFDFFAYNETSYPLPDQTKDIGYEEINTIVIGKTIALVQFYFLIKLGIVFISYLLLKIFPKN